MGKTKQISITLSEEILAYVEYLAAVNCRSRSGMIEFILQAEKHRDEALDEEARNYDKNNRVI